VEEGDLGFPLRTKQSRWWGTPPWGWGEVICGRAWRTEVDSNRWGTKACYCCHSIFPSQQTIQSQRSNIKEHKKTFIRPGPTPVLDNCG
jgi:hypothetical protein